MTSRFRVPGLLVRRLEEERLPLPAIVRRAGLPAGFFEQERMLVSTDELFSLWRAIADESGDPTLGLRLGTDARSERFDPTALAALCSRSFGDALRRVARYKQLTCPEEIRISTAHGESTVEFVWLLAREAEPVVLVDLCLSWILAIGRRGTGGELSPLRLELTRAFAQREAFERHFGCPARLAAARNALVFRASDLERPFVTHNAELLAMLGPPLDAQLADSQAHRTVVERAAAALKGTLAGQRPALKDVARHLGLSPRTLQRRLAEGGLSFHRLVERARREMAMHYLADSSLELNETAYLLGYEDANSFFRAFQQWEGTSPGAWRSRHRNRAVAAQGFQAAGATATRPSEEA
jgi:AraC-like DNA-binding protein